ncbi:hypothetical protein CEP51_011978 [Fusarium floridanum]|uniref:Uncharacterized protein n=1 Tax=Fusarium floridanum TaxID=1325733 RepID=A0A428R3A2_9HYPO|nr:hypothetical protein CEP51_011978 [Fusarium floridanum]
MRHILCRSVCVKRQCSPTSLRSSHCRNAHRPAQPSPEVDSDRRTWFQVTLSLYKTLNGLLQFGQIESGT